MYELYEHHGERVWVKSDLRGKHREHCLCHSCGKLKIGDRENSCWIATLLFSLCILQNIVTPVWECPKFSPKENA